LASLAALTMALRLTFCWLTKTN